MRKLKKPTSAILIAVMLFTNSQGINIYANEDTKKESISIRDSLKTEEFKPEITNKIISNYSAKNTSEGSAIIDIPDENLKAGINKALGKNSDEEITKAELESIQSLDLSELRIKNLKGIENCINLTSLDLYSNDIKDISLLRNLTNLKYLDLSATYIKDISVLSNLINLVVLDLSFTDIKDISALGSLINLKHLELMKSNIKDISALGSLINLTGLDLMANEISDISVLNNLINLKYLNLRENKVSDISGLSNLINLNILELNANDIKDISALGNLINLKYLTLNFNEIEDISALSNLTNLTILNLSDNKIKDISTLSNLTNLTILVLSYNEIEDISALGNLINLGVLDLYCNSISDISSLRNLTNLKYLELGDNKVEDISALSNLTNLIGLSLMQNEIEDISALSNLTNLTDLSLSYNKIEDVSALSNLTNLTDLSLRQNEIKDISALSNLINLTNLYLSNNEIEDISALSNLINLTNLSLGGNKIEDISALSNLINLTNLSLYVNKIEDISALSNLTNLTDLDLRYNKITDLRALENIQKMYDGNFRYQNIELEPIYTTSSFIKVNIPSVYDNKGNKLNITTSNSAYSIDGDNLVFENIQDTKEITFGFSTQLAFIDGRRYDYDVKFHQPVIKLVEGMEVENKGQATELDPVVFSIKTDKSVDEIIKKLNESKYTYTLVDKPRIENNNKIYKLRLNGKVKQEISDKFIEFKVSLDDKQIIEKLDNAFRLTSHPTVPEEPTPEQPKPEEPPTDNSTDTEKPPVTDNNTGTKPPTNNTVNFSDIENHWAKYTIKEFASKGYIVGYEDKTFKPDIQMTRAEFIKLVNKTLGYTSKGENHFKDVNENQWFYNDVCIAIKQGYINGKSKDEFAPNDKITRQEVAMILTNIYKNKDNNIDKLNKFKDGTNVDEWAKSSVEGLIEAGYLSGYEDNTIKAKENITRAEATVILSRVINK